MRAQAGSGATIDGVYRYRLWRTLNQEGKHHRILFVMLNPSTADGSSDDATLRRCRGFALDWGYRVLEVCNLYAYRATDPSLLDRVRDPIGPYNDRHILAAARRADTIVAAWGARANFSSRASEVTRVLVKAADVHCLGTTQNGAPRHPLYVSRTETLRPYIRRAR